VQSSLFSNFSPLFLSIILDVNLANLLRVYILPILLERFSKMCEKEQKQKQPENGLQPNWAMDGTRISGKYKVQKLEV
jgi:hypothetical protein